MKLLFIVSILVTTLVGCASPQLANNDRAGVEPLQIPYDQLKKHKANLNNALITTLPDQIHKVASAPVQILVFNPFANAKTNPAAESRKFSAAVWDLFFRRYKIQYKTVSDLSKLDDKSSSILVLPSAFVLDEKERKAIADFRNRGGGVLSTWYTGIMDAHGAWTGLDFMRDVLRVDVIGSALDSDELKFMMPASDNALTRGLLPGDRIWMTRKPGYEPIKLYGQMNSAYLMDWGRKEFAKSGPLVVHGEHIMPSNMASRAVTFGYNESTWQSGDLKALDNIAYSALMWLLRQPNAHIGVWPDAKKSGLTFAIDVPDPLELSDATFLKSAMDQAKGKATLYVNADIAQSSKAGITKMVEAKHEIGVLCDTFEPFAGQSVDQQTVRLNRAVTMLDKAGITLKKPLAFHSAMESQDAATREALNKAGFSSNLVFMDTVESRLPQVDKNHPNLLLIPQTLSNPEGILAEGDPDEAFAQFVREINLSHDMGGMTLIKFMARSSLGTDQLATIWKMSADPKMNFWHSSVGDVTNWIRQKNSMSNEIVLSKNSASIFLKYSTEGHFNPTIIVDLPFSGSNPVMTVRSTGQIIKPIIRGLAAYFVINSELAKDVDLSVSFDSH